MTDRRSVEPTDRRRVSRRALLAAVGTGTAVSTAGCTVERSTDSAGAWSYPGRDVRNTNRHPGATGVREPSVAWTVDAYERVFAPPVVAGGVAYVGDYGGGVHAVDVGDGSVRWRSSLGNKVWELAAVGDELYAAANRVYALDRRSGGRRYRWLASGALGRIPNGYCRGPIAGEGRLYVTSYRDRAVYALGPSWGRPRWRATVGAVNQKPALRDGTCYVAAGDTVYALAGADGSTEWSFERAGNDFVSPTVADGAVFTGDRGVYAIDADTGQERWHRRSPPRPSGGLAYTDGLVLCGDSHRGVFALDAESGEERWQTDLPGQVRRAPSVAGCEEAVVYAATKDGFVAALAAASGRVLWRHDNGDPIRSAPTPVDGGVLYADETGTVTALEAPRSQASSAARSER
jgi:outer membrane protein assembly factor BamB